MGGQAGNFGCSAPGVEDLRVDLLTRLHGSHPRPEWVAFWLCEARTAELIQQLVQRYPVESQAWLQDRPLLAHAIQGDLDTLRATLDAEVRAEQARDRAYWEPLRRELEAFRREERPRGDEPEA